MSTMSTKDHELSVELNKEKSAELESKTLEKPHCVTEVCYNQGSSKINSDKQQYGLIYS